jgi:PAS domain S-box-containing protein
LMIEASPVPMIVYEENRNYFVNKKFVETFGYTIEDIPGVNEWWPLAYPDEEYRESVKQRWYAAIDIAVKNGTNIEPQEVVVTCKDGSKKHILVHFSSIGEMNFCIFHNITERKQAEEALRESEERYHSLFEHMLSGFAYCKMLYDDRGNPEDFIYLIVNSAFGRLTGLENVAGKRATEAIPGIKELHPELLETYGRVATTGMPEQFEIEFKPLVAWLSVSVHSTGQGYFTAVFDNITERKRAEEALNKIRANLEKSQEIAHLGSWELDLRDNSLFWSDEVYRIFGLQPQEFGATYEAFLAAVHPDDRAAVDAAYSSSVREGRDAYEIEHRVVRKSTGEVRFVHEKCKHFLDKSGRIIRSVGMVHDITERKQAEKKLAHVASFPELNSAPILEINDDGKITYGNPSSDRIFPDLAALGSNHPALKEILASEDSFSQTECRQYVRDIEINGVYYQQTILRVPGRRTTRIYCTDITERKRAEEEARASKAQAELYLDLMCHDISNMHQIAMGYLEFAQETLQLEQEHRELIDQPAEVLRRSARLINNVRKLRQNQEGLFQYQTVDMCAVLADVSRDFGAVSGKNITLNLNGSDRCQVRANELLYDVFANLVSNAIKHTGSRAEIRISVERAEDNGRQCYKVSVADNGPGIPDDFKDKVFNRLLKNTMRAKGMGLGLYLVKSLVDSYSGWVWVEDRVPGDYTKGAKFVVVLPALSINDK